MPAAPVIAAVAAATGAAYSVYSGERAASEQRKAERRAERQARQAEQDANRARRNPADAGALIDRAAQSARAGAPSTMLTGPQGVDPNQMTLGRNTLLGG